MKAPTRFPLFLSFALLAFAGTFGCALFNKSDSVNLRFFTPEQPTTTSAVSSDPATRSSADGGAATAVHDIRLGKVSSAGYLRERIAYRSAGNEIGYLDGQVRWTESPEDYLRRALSKDLFETRGLRQRISGPGLTLEVELTGFEEVRGPNHVARVASRWWLRDEHHVLIQRSSSVERPIEGGDGDPMAVTRALGAGLQSAVSELGAVVAAEVDRAAVRN